MLKVYLKIISYYIVNMKKYNNRDYLSKHPRTRLNNKYHTPVQSIQPPPPPQYPHTHLNTQVPIQPPVIKESMMSNIAGSVIQGIALGTGSQLASRGIDAIMGSRKIEIIDKPVDNCINENDVFIKCVKNNDNDTTQCRNLFDLLDKCKKIDIK